MISETEREQILALIKREVVPAIGCTEPIAVALCVAKAAETLGQTPESVSVRLSANILKNAMGVGIPGTGMTGLPIAVALGALAGRSEYGLEVLRDVDAQAVARGKQYLAEGRVWIALKKDACDKLYIEVEARCGEHDALCVISGSHTHFVRIVRDGRVLLDETPGGSGCDEGGDLAWLNLAKIWEFAMQAPLDELRFILEAKRLNTEECGADEEHTIRALTLSHLTAIYIKQSLGCLSALCGCVVAATGSSCGITYLMGGGYDEVCSAVKNMIANLTGMICDGAKPSCALKLSSGVSTAVLSAMMAMEHECVSSVEGIIDSDVDQCIRNLTTIGRDGMNETDRLILDIMTHKHSDIDKCKA